MTRTMYDAVDWTRIPEDAQMVAGYVDGPRSKWAQGAWARFPNATIVRIAVFPTTDDGVVLDVEPGDAEPGDVPAWLVMRRGHGVDPTVYGSASGLAAVKTACIAAGVAEPHYWLAAPDGDATLPGGFVAKQYQWTDAFDLSVVADYWPGVDLPAPPISAGELEYACGVLLYPGIASADNNGHHYAWFADAASDGARRYTLTVRP